MRALLQEDLGNGKTRCNVCAYRCELSEGQIGRCRVRRNEGGEIRYLAYDQMSATCPFVGNCAAGSYCVGKPSCNWSCSFCLNATETVPEFAGAYSGGTTPPLTDDGYLDKKSLLGDKLPVFPLESFRKKSPRDVVEDWKASGLPWFAIRNTEPSIHVEAVSEMFRLVKDAGGSVFINTNGYWTPETVKALGPLVDFVEVGIKGSANPLFMRKVSGVPNVAPIFDTVRALSDYDCELALTDLVLYHRDWQSDFSKVCAFVADTIPQRSFPRLSIGTFAGYTPLVAFGHFKLGYPIQITDHSMGESRGELLLRAVDVALEHLDMLWLTGIGSLPKEEQGPFYLALPDAKAIEGRNLRVARSPDDLGEVLDVQPLDSDPQEMADRITDEWGDCSGKATASDVEKFLGRKSSAEVSQAAMTMEQPN